LVVIDATTAPPPLQFAMAHGVDIVYHSMGKYFGGHSDIMAGALILRSDELYKKVTREYWCRRFLFISFSNIYFSV
jgi:cystathionine gamma-lyase